MRPAQISVLEKWSFDCPRSAVRRTSIWRKHTESHFVKFVLTAGVDAVLRWLTAKCLRGLGWLIGKRDSKARHLSSKVGE